MTKIPQSGLIKTRLTPDVNPEEAAELAWCFLRDTIAKLQQLNAEVWYAVTPPNSIALVKNLELDTGRLFVQEGDNLGARMNHAFETVLGRNLVPAVLIGSDLPTLPVEHMVNATRILESKQADLVFTPTRDGGFGLIAMNQPWPALMDCVEWSAETTLQQVLTRARMLRLRYTLLPEWYDIDVVEDLVTLRAELESNEAARNGAPNTWRWMARYEDRCSHPNP